MASSSIHHRPLIHSRPRRDVNRPIKSLRVLVPERMQADGSDNTERLEPVFDRSIHGALTPVSSLWTVRGPVSVVIEGVVCRNYRTI